jgi:hypothetical protein
VSHFDEDRLVRLRIRLWKIEVAAVTVLATAWLVTLGPVLAILALLVAKHVLVALLLVPRDPEECSPDVGTGLEGPFVTDGHGREEPYRR